MISTQRSGMPFESFEDNLITATASKRLGELAKMLMRTKAEVLARRDELTDSNGKPRMCIQCKHHGAVGTCGIEIEGLAHCSENWAATRVYGNYHVCHLGLTA